MGGGYLIFLLEKEMLIFYFFFFPDVFFFGRKFPDVLYEASDIFEIMQMASVVSLLLLLLLLFAPHPWEGLANEKQGPILLIQALLKMSVA